MSTIIKKWMCGSRWGDKPYRVAEVEFVETAKRFTLVDTPENKALSYDVIGCGSHFSKTDKRLSDTREAAIQFATKVRAQERDVLLRKLVKAKQDIDHLERLLTE